MSTRDHSPKRSYRTRLPRRIEPEPEVVIVGPRTKAELHALIRKIFHTEDAATFYGIKEDEFITQNDEYGMTLSQCVDRIVHEIWIRQNAKLLEFPEYTIALASSILYISPEAGYGLFLSVFSAMEFWAAANDWASSVALAVSISNGTSGKALRRALSRLSSRFSEKLSRECLLQEFADFDLEDELRESSNTRSGIKVAYERTRVVESTHSPPWRFGYRTEDVRHAAHGLDMDISCAKDILFPALVSALESPTHDFWECFVKGARAVHEKTPFSTADVAGAVAAYNCLPYRTYNLDGEFVEVFMRDMADEPLQVPAQLTRLASSRSVSEKPLFTPVDDE